MAEAVDRMVVHQPDRLHERVTDGGPHELEVPAQQVAAERIGFRRARGDLTERAPVVHPRRPADEAPHVRVEAAELALYPKECFRVADGARDLQTISDDPGI